jgi:hypothetical protein
LQPRGDLCFADASTVEFPYLVSMESCSSRPAQALAVLACMRQAATDLFPGNVPFEFREDRQQAMARPAGIVRSKASVSETSQSTITASIISTV